MPIHPFQVVCLFVLLDHHRTGIEKTHPDYIKEKLWMLEPQNLADAFMALDVQNRVRVLVWCEKWDMPIPATITGIAANATRRTEPTRAD